MAKPKLAVFPKCFLRDLCNGKMTVYDWIDLASTLPIEGLEFYNGFLPKDKHALAKISSALRSKRLRMPMLCCSPDFTDPDEDKRKLWVEKEKEWIDLTAFLGGKICRVLSGQRRPDVSREEGVEWVVQCIETCLDHAKQNRVTLAMENHYKDDFWQYPEFAQKLDVFLEIIDQIDSDWFGVNYDPSNAILAGHDPIQVLKAVESRVVSMHASDRYLTAGTIEDLSQADGIEGYSSNLAHGVIGKGLVNYDRVFDILSSAGFDGWISVEDGVHGIHEIRESVDFLLGKIHEHFA